MSKKNKKRIYVSKRIDNYPLYFYADVFDDLRGTLEKFLPDEISKKLYDISECIHKEIGHLQCDEYTNFYIVECGYNIRKNK